MADDVCAGIDWAKDTHDVFVADSDGERLVQRQNPAAAVSRRQPRGAERRHAQLLRVGQRGRAADDPQQHRRRR